MGRAYRGWQFLLRRDVLLLATVGVCLLNGMWFSPAFDPMSYYLSSFSRGSRFYQPDLIYYATSLLLALLTLMLAAIPAALYERARGLDESTPISLIVWLVTALLLTLPALIEALSPDSGLAR